MAAAPAVAAAALLVRDDGRVLLVRHRDDDGAFAGRWSLPMEPVAPQETVEEALERALRDRMHVEPGRYEFAETLYLVGEDGGRVVVNAFACRGWAGEPRFGRRHYQDAAWIGASALSREHGGGPAGLGDALSPELRAWLARELGAPRDGRADGVPPRSRAELLEELAAARAELMAAFEALPGGGREPPGGGSWTAVDVLVRAGSAEAYLAAEARRLLELPGHAWRPFNVGQWESEQRSRERPAEAAARERLLTVRAETEAWLAGLEEAELAAYGLHRERGAVTISSRVVKIGVHDREQAGVLGRLGERRDDAGAGRGSCGRGGG